MHTINEVRKQPLYSQQVVGHFPLFEAYAAQLATFGQRCKPTRPALQAYSSKGHVFCNSVQASNPEALPLALEAHAYNGHVYKQRASVIESHALLARPVLLPAWQQCTAYLSEILVSCIA